MKDLIILVADKNTESAIQGLLLRPKALGIRSNLKWDIFVHPQRDPGCLRNAHNFLKPFCKEYSYALIIFDREGCGKENLSVKDLEEKVQKNLKSSGWDARAEVIVIDPELEVWVFSNSPHVVDLIAEGDKEAYHNILSKEERTSTGKPCKPKQVMENILREKNIPRSSAIYKQLAKKVSLSKCCDPSFNQLCKILKTWFPE